MSNEWINPIVIFLCGVLLGVLIFFGVFYPEFVWKEGDAYITFIYDYEGEFWRVTCGGQFSYFQGDYAIASNYAQAINLTEGWWHIIVKGGHIIYAEKVK